MNRFYAIVLSLFFPGTCMQSQTLSLSEPSKDVNIVGEIALQYNTNLVEHFNALTPQERVFIYYLYRASLAGNIIAADQSHRDTLAIRALLEYILEKKDELFKSDLPFDALQFTQEIETYLTYLWTNHSAYFVREHADEKRTPERLNLTLLTPEHLADALTALKYPQAQEKVAAIKASLFDRTYESTQTVPDSITQSGVNFYAPDFSDEDFKAIDAQGQRALNAYFYIDTKEGKRIPTYQLYSVNGKYAQELLVAVYWLQKAYELAQKYPQQFDNHLVKSLEYLIAYLKTGDEELFKKHSIEWLKSNSKVDYTFGFIETYDDPKSYRAIFQSDVTIKSIDMDTLNQLLPTLERRLPINAHYKRTLDGPGAIPNASINVKAFSAGSLGPINLTLAYCLPNYEEIRSEHGSKQIIYHVEKSIGELINPSLARCLFNGTEYYNWFNTYDPEYQLMRDISMLEVILHETLGHGSGKLAEHTFKEGEELTIEGKTYKVGDTIPVTSSNIQQLLAGYDQTIEELRAEIIALLASIIGFDELAKAGMLKEWPPKVDKEKLIDFSIISMARTGLRRFIQQADNATEIAGDHARANNTILNYLIDKGAIELRIEPVTVDGKEYSVVDVYILDRQKAFDTIEELANLVQEIKSTGDGLKARWLIDTFGKPIKNREHFNIMKDNMKAAAGEVRLSAMIQPLYEPIKNKKGEIVDISAEWPVTHTEAQRNYKRYALSTD